MDVSQLSDRELLARLLEAEAGSEGATGKLAVGSVIQNRLSSGRFGETLRDVMMAPGQFSPLNSVTGYAGGEQGVDFSRITPSRTTYDITDAILSGQYEDPTGGATHFYNPEISQPSWGGGENWTPIGRHVFGTADGAGALVSRASSQNGPALEDLRAPVREDRNLVEGIGHLFKSVVSPEYRREQEAAQTQAMEARRSQVMQAIEAGTITEGEGERLLLRLEEQAEGPSPMGLMELSQGIAQAPALPRSLPTTVLRGRGGSGTSAIQRLGVRPLA